MIVGVPKEIKNNENRVGLVPSGVKALKDHGHTVLVQATAGNGIGVSDEDFRKAGATIVETAKDVFSKAEMIIKVKEPLPEEYNLLRENQILYTYLHLAPALQLTKALMEKRVTAVAYETIQYDDGSLPLLTPMSEVAGRMSTQIGAHHLEKANGGKGILLGGVPGVQRGKVTILGGGVAGINAAKIAIGMGAQVSILDVNSRRLEYLDHIFGGTVQTLFSNHENILTAVRECDLLIGAVLIAGAKAPKLVSKDLIGEMGAGSVVIDIAVDQGGCIETCKPTSHDHPTYSLDGVIHYAVPNMPGAVARTSTYALTNVTLKYALMLADLGFKDAVARDKALYKGVNVYNGKVSYLQVAKDLDLPYEAVSV
ncbi:MAG: alanine dehydrogenase [Bacteriovoracia bacterium]